MKTASWNPSVRKDAARSGLGAARIRLETGRLDAGERAELVVVGGVAGNTDRADDVAAGVADQHTAWIGDDAPAARGGQHVEELRRVRRTLGERARAESHAERAPCLSVGDVEAQDARLVLALESDEMSAGIEHGDGERLELHL